MIKLLLTLAIFSISISTAFSNMSVSNVLLDEKQNLKTLNDLKNIPLICTPFVENKKLLECIEQSDDRAIEYFKEFNINTNADNPPTISYFFESANEQNKCSYNMPKSTLPKCNNTDSFKIKFFYIAADDLSSDDVNDFFSVVDDKYTFVSSDVGKLGDREVKTFVYKSVDNKLINIATAYALDDKNNNSITVNY